MATVMFDRVQAKAGTFHPLKVLLTVLAAPFYVLGWIVGVLWVAFAWVCAAVVVGCTDARNRKVT